MSFRVLLGAVLIGSVAACAPEIGNSCESSLDCSTNNTRQCDRTQPGGYCTISGCEKNTCPDESICVKFNPAVQRLSVTYCMKKCDDSGGCRDGEGYHCTSGDDFGAAGSFDALVLEDNVDQKFCSIPALLASDETMSMPDAGGDDDAGAENDAGSPGS